MKNGPEIGRLGYSAMVLEDYYGKLNDAKAIKTIAYAIEKEMMIETADAYGGGDNEALVGKAIKETKNRGICCNQVWNCARRGSDWN